MKTREKLRLLLKRRSPRERVFLGGGGALVALILLYFFFLAPLWERALLLSRLIPQKEEEIQAFKRLKDEYLSLLAQSEAIKNRLPQKNQFAPLSYLEQVAARQAVRKSIAYIRPVASVAQAPYREIPMEIKMEEISLDQIVPFLATLESAPYFMRMKRLHFKTDSSDSKKLDVTFVLSSYEKM